MRGKTSLVSPTVGSENHFTNDYSTTIHRKNSVEILTRCSQVTFLEIGHDSEASDSRTCSWRICEPSSTRHRIWIARKNRQCVPGCFMIITAITGNKGFVFVFDISCHVMHHCDVTGHDWATVVRQRSTGWPKGIWKSKSLYWCINGHCFCVKFHFP